ncbi:MAG: hypothetical protein ACOVLH_03340 [Roseateles sp.]
MPTPQLLRHFARPLALSLPLLLALALSAPAHAQTSRWTLKALEVRAAPSAERSEPPGLQMPFLSGPKTAVAARVNEHLFIALLQAMPPERAQGRWSLPTPVDPQLSELSHELFRLDERVLSLRTLTTGCGAYCEGSYENFHFDLRQGRRVWQEELITPAGQSQLAQQAQQRQIQTYEALLKKQRADLAALRKRKPSPGLAEEIQTQLALVSFTENCLSSSRSASAGALGGNLQLRARVLQLRLSGCAGFHAERGLDEAGEIEVSWPYEAVRGQLSAYGRALLLGEALEADAAPAPDWAGQVLKGQIAGSPVTLLFRAVAGQDEGRLQGVYFYDRHRRPLFLKGRATPEGQLFLEERSAEEVDAGAAAQARWELRAQGAQLKGDWKGSKKVHPISLEGL